MGVRFRRLGMGHLGELGVKNFGHQFILRPVLRAAQNPHAAQVADDRHQAAAAHAVKLDRASIPLGSGDHGQAGALPGRLGLNDASERRAPRAAHGDTARVGTTVRSDGALRALQDGTVLRGRPCRTSVSAK